LNDWALEDLTYRLKWTQGGTAVSEPWTPTKVFITAKTYPLPAWKGIEVSCTGGITDSGEWIRLFPVPFRFLDEDKKFRKYQWIDVRAKRSSDHRLESRYLDRDSIKILTDPLPTEDRWKARKDVILPLASPSLCWLQAKRDRDGFPTLGFFKPREICRFKIDSVDPEWTVEQLARLKQDPLFGPKPAIDLEKLPFKPSYKFFCEDSTCPSHTLMCSDWELGASWWRWSQKYTDWKEPFLQRYERDMMERLDTHFFVGTTKAHPQSWIIVGLFYPPKEQSKTPSLNPIQATLF
jgi:hypothetical protein